MRLPNNTDNLHLQVLPFGEDLGGDFSDISRKLHKIDQAIIDNFTNDIYNNRHSSSNLHEPLYNQYYNAFKKQAEAGYGKTFDKADTIEELQLTAKMKENISKFAAGKQQILTASLERALYDANGKKLSKQEFDKAAAPILRQYNKNFYRTETDTIRNLTIAAKEWQDIKAQAYLYPNLRYETVGDDRVRDEHWTLDGIVRPVSDPFWKTHFPPNGWNCRCVTIQTDDEPTELPDVVPQNAKGFNQNVGETGELFSEDHPYFQMPAATKDKIFQEAEKSRAKNNRDNIKSLAKEKFVEGKTEIIVPEIEKPVKVTTNDIKNMLAHFHDSPAMKDEIIANLDLVAPNMKLLKTAPNSDSKKPYVTKFLYYLFQMNGKAFYFNIQMMIEGSEEFAKFYAINYILR